jgi:hypothetical protein
MLSVGRRDRQMMDEEALQEIRFEVEYWIKIIKSLAAINESIDGMNGSVGEQAIGNVMLMSLTFGNERAQTLIEKHMEYIDVLQKYLADAVAEVTEAIQMAKGRQVYLTGKIHEEDDHA